MVGIVCNCPDFLVTTERIMTIFKIVRNIALAAVAVTAALATQSAPANAGSNPYIGEMMLVGFNFCPRGRITAEGQLLSIAQNSALFSLLGTSFGGDGRTTFGVPDLRGHVPLGQGTGPGLSPVAIGQKSGAETAAMNVTNLAPHSHNATATSALNGTGAAADVGVVAGNSLARSGSTSVYNAAAPTLPMADGSVTTTVTVASSGSGQAFSIRNPYLGMQWCVVTEGTFPPRN